MPKNMSILPEKPTIQNTIKESIVHDAIENKINPTRLFTKSEIKKYYPNLEADIQSNIKNEIIPRYLALAEKMGYTSIEISKLEETLTKAASEIKPVVYKDFGEKIAGQHSKGVPGISTRYNPKTADIKSVAIHEGGHAYDFILDINMNVQHEIMGNKMFDKVPKHLQSKIDSYLHRAFPNPMDVEGFTLASANIGEKRSVMRQIRNVLLDNFGLLDKPIGVQNNFLSSIPTKQLYKFLEGYSKESKYLQDYLKQIDIN